MKLTSLAVFCAAAALLTACAKYTEQTSPCFGKDGKPILPSAALSFAASDPTTTAKGKDCTFKTLPRPE